MRQDIGDITNIFHIENVQYIQIHRALGRLNKIKVLVYSRGTSVDHIVDVFHLYGEDYSVYIEGQSLVGLYISLGCKPTTCYIITYKDGYTEFTDVDPTSTA